VGRGKKLNTVELEGSGIQLPDGERKGEHWGWGRSAVPERLLAHLLSSRGPQQEKSERFFGSSGKNG